MILEKEIESFCTEKKKNLLEAEKYIAMCRGMVDSELTALVSLSLTRNMCFFF